MPAKTNKEPTFMDEKDSPAVLAYRVGELEKSVANGFKAVERKLDQMNSNQASKVELEEVRIELKADLAGLQGQIHVLERRRWVQNTLSAILGVVLTLLVTDFVKNMMGG